MKKTRSFIILLWSLLLLTSCSVPNNNEKNEDDLNLPYLYAEKVKADISFLQIIAQSSYDEAKQISKGYLISFDNREIYHHSEQKIIDILKSSDSILGENIIKQNQSIEILVGKINELLRNNSMDDSKWEQIIKNEELLNMLNIIEPQKASSSDTDITLYYLTENFAGVLKEHKKIEIEGYLSLLNEKILAYVSNLNKFK
ncbi:hypothetical protein [Paenibacillus wynnii]|nr:hypothetical protein [Paenibacillus wynnii]